LYVGAINKPRGLDTIAEALSISNLAKEKIIVYVVGAGSYRASFEGYIKELGLSDLFKFYGHQNMSTILKIMQLSDIGIIPHFRSPQNDCSSPNKLFQYMYAELPVVVSNCVSLERVVSENECGYVFEEKNAESLALQLEEIILNSEIAKQKGIAGKSLVINRFNTFHEGENLKNYYLSF
jgi:glycosyltransferase involved in cell wall biosynthesis